MATKKPTTKTNVAEEVPQPSTIEDKLDRIIELLEGALTVKQQGLNLTGKWWDRFLK